MSIIAHDKFIIYDTVFGACGALELLLALHSMTIPRRLRGTYGAIQY